MHSGLPTLNPALATLLLALATAAVPADEAADRHFLEHVRPLLDSRCVSCHGPDKQKGNLRLDSREATLRGGDLGPAIVPGEPQESLLLQAVIHAKPDLEMPPKDRLGTNDIAVFHRWIDDGAPWPMAEAVIPHAPAPAPSERIGPAWSDPRNPIVRIFAGQRLDLWSLKPLQRREVPLNRPHPQPGHSPGRNPIDHFIDARLAAAGLRRSPEADRRVLARRLHYDLTGLPPEPETVERFVANPRPNAYERLVDELLASPRYGEHQARLWLDVIRYSDSNGFDWDEFRPQAWRFRDYVIRAFNADKPFDAFIREQLAGDELLDGPPRNEIEQDWLIATGYLRVGPQDNSASLFNEQARARAEWLADLTETTGSAFLGVTLSCCRCHDHKYDPFSQADHFRMRAFFEPVKRADDLALDLADTQEAIRKQHQEIETRTAPLSRDRETLIASVRDRVRAERVARLTDDERRLLALASDPQPQDFKEQAAALAKKVEPSDEDVLRAATEDENKRHQALQEQIEAIARTKRPFTTGLFATDSTNQVPPTRILFQGDPAAERDSVEPGFLSILDPNPAPIRPPSHLNATGRRLTLAEWIASPANPLTARVFANRAWQTFFGRGLVETPNDFGLAGVRPTHPELLDWLAVEFIERGWSVKQLHRLIVTSATYRQASTDGRPPIAKAEAGQGGAPTSTSGSAVVDSPGAESRDAGNTFYWRQNLRRLSAEQLRDSLLAVAGALQLREGGPAAWPELPPEVLQANPAFLDDNAEKTKGWYPSPPDRRAVRSIFLVQKRTVRVPFLETFDLPENSGSCPQRTVSIVAPQALTLLNGTEAVDAARSLAARIAAATGGSGRAAVVRAFALALQRQPTGPELAACEHYLAGASLTGLCRALLNLNEFVYLD